MQLIKLTLHNFRQFKDETIEFAQGNPEKNVTIVIGENGTGKTTLEQSFSWCFYGKTGFSDKILLNRDIAEALVPGKAADVRVAINLEYNESVYTIIREQTYEKTYGNKVQVKNTSFDIQYIKPNGKPEWVPKTQCESVVANIMPEAMSSYFFFDGERINKMGKEISSDKKVSDFENAVRGLLGLDAIMAALKHLNPRSQNSVIGSYDKAFVKNQSDKVATLNKEIQDKKERLAIVRSHIEQYTSEIEKANDLIAQKQEEMKTYDEGKQLLEKKKHIQQELVNAEEFRNATYKDICDSFSRNLSAFMSLSLIKRAITFIDSRNLGQYDLPYVREETLDYLLKQGICLCGRPLAEHTPEHDHVKALYSVLPPKSLGTVAKDFRNEGTARITNSQDMRDATLDKFKIVSNQDSRIEKARIELDALEKKMTGEDVQAQVSNLQLEINACKRTLRDDQEKLSNSKNAEGRLEQEIESKETERTRLNLQNKDNRKIEIQLAYAKRIHSDFKALYEKEEQKIKNRLQKTINELFMELYNGRLELKIADKYHIEVIDKDYESGVETSEGQNISVIFAFISAIIKMARENGQNNEEFLSSETYPLVMDAPLSTFDKTRIDNVCRMLPTIAEQVIIFIKDTDGDIAREKMGKKIGRAYRFDQTGQFTTHIAPEM